MSTLSPFVTCSYCNIKQSFFLSLPSLFIHLLRFTLFPSASPFHSAIFFCFLFCSENKSKKLFQLYFCFHQNHHFSNVEKIKKRDFFSKQQHTNRIYCLSQQMQRSHQCPVSFKSDVQARNFSFFFVRKEIVCHSSD